MVTLYTINIGLGGGHTAGLIYDQVRHKATVAPGIEDFGFVWPINEQQHNQNLWHPLETVLTNWIEMIRQGKITATHLEDDDHPEESENERFGPWGWKSYAPGQIDSTVRAFDQLADAIEQRISTSSGTTITRPLLSDADLDVALVPQGSFIRSFLTRIRTTKSRFIAPGLMVPFDAAAFAESQTFTRIDTADEGENGVIIPPILLFSAEDGETVSFESPDRYRNRNPFCRPFQNGLAPGVRVPAGLYSENVERGSVDNAEEEFRLVLPFTLRDRKEGEEEEEEEEGGGGGARKSDGQLVEVGSLADLFQHGYNPFGGEWWRAQRLERLFEHWRGLVENGAWTVGPNGVEGGLGKFREAKGERWRDCWIAPSG